MPRSLTDSWRLGEVAIPNRVVLAPLAGIGNWFVRLQAKRHGAGLVVSEMVSSFAVHYRNERTCRELLRIHPQEHPVSVQLFGNDPDVMASAAERVAAAGADLIDINMGCPVPKVCKTGAGAALLVIGDEVRLHLERMIISSADPPPHELVMAFVDGDPIAMFASSQGTAILTANAIVTGEPR